MSWKYVLWPHYFALEGNNTPFEVVQYGVIQ